MIKEKLDKSTIALVLKAEKNKDEFMMKASQLVVDKLSATNYNSAIYFKSLKNGDWVEMNGIKALQEHFFVVIGIPQLPKHLTEIFKTVMSLSPECDIPSNVLYTPTQKLEFNTKTGELHVQPRDAELEEHYYPSIPIEYDAKASLPRWMSEVITRSFGNDKQKMQAYFQMIGLTLFMERRSEVSYWFTGKGGTGKSTVIIEVLNGILDKRRDISTIAPSNWDEEKFFMHGMMGKRVNISADSSNNRVLETGAFKKLVSGEPVQANIKGVTPATFENKALLVSIGNELPVITEKSSGPFRRMIVIDMNNVVAEADKNYDIKDDIVSNKDGVLNGILLLAITAMKKFYIDGKKAVNPSASVENVLELQKANNSIAIFIDDIEIDSPQWKHYYSDFGVKFGDLFTWYNAWSKDSGYRPFAKYEFFKLISDAITQNKKFDLFYRNNQKYIIRRKAVELQVEDPFEKEQDGKTN